MLGALIGRFRVLQQIGEGGMAQVYLAEHPVIGRRVAIKVMRPELAGHAELVARFFQEARVQAMITHPGVVDVFDFGHHDSGVNYIVMELLAGNSLQAMLAAHGRLHWSSAAELGRAIAGAVAAAHRVQVVHRDLKPANLLLVDDPSSRFGMRPKVLDFGVAKLAAGSMRTQLSLLGTPRYMAPEQASNPALVDGRADIYALGCILYEMVCGRPPFTGSLGEIIAAHMRTEPVQPARLSPGLPPALDSIIMRALAKQPDHRIATMDDFGALLGQVLTERRAQ